LVPARPQFGRINEPGNGRWPLVLRRDTCLNKGKSLMNEFEPEVNMITEMQTGGPMSQSTRSVGNVAGSTMPVARSGNEDWVERKYRSTENLATAKMATGLGIFSIALGLAEVLMPGPTSELAGLNNNHKPFLPALGLREIASGIGIMKSTDPTMAMWSRVGGDAIDLAFLGMAFMSQDTNKRRLIGSTIAVLGVTAMDIICAQKLSSENWDESISNPNAPTTIGQTSGRRAFSA